MESWKSVHSAEKSWGKIKITLLNYWKHFQQNNNKSERNSMKKLIQLLLPFFIISSQVFAIAGFGLHFDQSMYSVAETTTPLTVGDVDVASITHHGFDNGFGIGGYLYVDAIPVVDLDIEVIMLVSPYDFSFIQNDVVAVDKEQFGWVSGSGYFTLQKKLFKLSIPLLAKAKLSAGAGMNVHSSIPMISQDMMESVMGAGNLGSGTLDTDELISYLKDNKVSTTGFHIQTGLQFKILMLDSFLYYRHIFVEDVILDAKGFGNLNFRLGMGF